MNIDLVTTSTPIYNLRVDVFPVDSRGLIVDRVSAYHLDQLPTLQTVPIESILSTYEGEDEVLSWDFLLVTAGAIAGEEAMAIERVDFEARREHLDAMLASR